MPHPLMPRPLLHRRHVLQGGIGIAAWLMQPGARAQVAAEPAGASAADFWRLARAGGCVFLMRHGATEAGLGDPPGFRLDDCRTQRNLSEAGRAASRQLGLRFRDEGVRLSAVYSSAWCRCLDTARLAFDPHYPAHQIWPALNSFFQGQGDAAAQTRAVLQRVATLHPPDNWMLVTHQVNITALTGAFPAMGEVFLTRADPQRPDRLSLLARLPA